MDVVNFVRWSRDLPDAALLPDATTIWLEWRNWDDYGWMVTFVPYVPVGGRWETPGEMVLSLLGREDGQPVKNTWNVMRGEETVPVAQESLDPEWYASMGRSLDYYSWFARRDAVHLLEAIADVMVPGAPLVRWRRFQVFADAFLRGSDTQKVLNEATDLITGARPDLVDLSFRYAFTLEGTPPPVEIPIQFDPTTDPQRRVAVLVGPNGTGKTSLLFALASDFAQFSEADSRARFVRPPRRLISRQVVVTNSAFDLPRRSALPQCASLSIVGLRYSPHPWERSLQMWEKDNQDETGEDREAAWMDWLWNQFPSPSALRRETVTRLSEPQRADLEVLRDERQDWSKVLDGIIEPERLERLIEYPDQEFDKLSAGQKSILLVLAGLASRLDQESIVLIDEPEAHLHPHFLVLFSRALHLLLEDRRSFAVIATHSPIVLRDVPSDCVTVLWRDADGQIRTRGLGLQSMGASQASLSADVFGVEPLVGWWVDQLRSMLKAKGGEALLNQFQPPLEPEVVALLDSIYGAG